MITIADWLRILRIHRRTFERMRTSGRIPPPDLLVGSRSPRWRIDTVRSFCEGGRNG
jgi:hypothetical protein